MDYDQLHRQMDICSLIARELHRNLHNSIAIHECGIIMPPLPLGYSFHVGVPLTLGLPYVAISISVLPYIMGNRGQPFDRGVPSTYVIGLVDNMGLPIRVGALGYEDTQLFYTKDDLIRELVRLSAPA